MYVLTPKLALVFAYRLVLVLSVVIGTILPGMNLAHQKRNSIVEPTRSPVSIEAHTTQSSPAVTIKLASRGWNVQPKVFPKVAKPKHNVYITYDVSSGDTLWALEQRFNIPIARLEAMNGLESTILHPGQTLRLAVLSQPNFSDKHLRALLRSAPGALIPVYQAAAMKYGIPWTVLVAIHREETDFSLGGAITSTAGAIGPMQFEPSTFAEYGVAAPGHRTPNICNVEDAIYSAAHLLAAKGFMKNPVGAILAYNQSYKYVHDVLTNAAI